MSNPSKSANATEAPTSGVTEAALESKLSAPGLDVDGQDFVTLMVQYYAVEGKIMPISTAVDDYMFTDAEYIMLINDPTVRAALEERGITVKGGHLVEVDPETSITESRAVGEANTPAWKDKALSPLQLIVANTMLDLIDTRSEKKKLQDLGVSTSKYAMWKKDPVFSGYLRERAESMLGESQHDAMLALMDKVRMGDMKAISMYLEMTGRFTQSSASSTGSTPMLDFKNLLIRILEIINDEVHDQEVAFNIAERLKGLIGANNVAGQLIQSVAEPITAPEVMPNRQLSPRLQELMDKGEGNN